MVSAALWNGRDKSSGSCRVRRRCRLLWDLLAGLERLGTSARNWPCAQESSLDCRPAQMHAILLVDAETMDLDDIS